MTKIQYNMHLGPVGPRAYIFCHIPHNRVVTIKLASVTNSHIPFLLGVLGACKKWHNMVPLKCNIVLTRTIRLQVI